MDYFGLLNIEKEYDIDLKILEQQYFKMQIKYHPDKARSEVEKQQNLSISIDLNKAYTILKDNLTRAEYLLFLNGIDIENLEIRKNLSKAQLNDIWGELETLEDTHDLEILEKLYEQKIREKEKIVTSITRAFKTRDLQNALDSTISLKYLSNLINNIKLKIKECK
jgi:molecular chaperone HscB